MTVEGAPTVGGGSVTSPTSEVAVHRVTSLERLFLELEQGQYPMDGAGIMLLDPSTAPDGFGFAAMREHFARKLADLPLLTRRLVRPPLGMGGGYWIEDPDFSLDHHLHHIAVPAPGDLDALVRLTLDISTGTLDRTRPLWDAWFVEGVEHGLAALIFRQHHASVDGMGGMQEFAALFDLDPSPQRLAAAAPAKPSSRVPSGAELALRSLPELATQPARLVKNVVDLARASRPARKAAAGTDRGRFLGPLPRTLFNRPAASPDKALGLASVPLDDVKTVKNAFGVTVNDVVLAVVTGALREYLLAHDDLPATPLVAAIPINVRTGGDEAAAGNHFTFMFNHLPTHLDDPVEQLLAAHDEAVANKRVAEARMRAVNPVAAIAELAPPNGWAVIGGLLSNPRVGRSMPPLMNLCVSNMAGPPFPLYVAGAKMLHMFGRTMLLSGVALFIHCISYADSVDFGVTTLRDVIPDPESIANGIEEHLGLLVKASRS
jgi:diacylglycerol O-acyltransferase